MIPPCSESAHPAGRSGPDEAINDHPDVEVSFTDLPRVFWPAIVAIRGTESAILMDRNLTSTERRCTLTHEMVHIERGGTADCLDVAREERTVDRMTAERLLPDGYLEGLIADLLAERGEVTAELVAERADVRIKDALLRLNDLLAKRHVTARHQMGGGA